MPDSPNDRRVGIRIRTFEACSGFTFVSAHGIAQQPKAAFVAGLRPSQLPSRAACQLPDQSTFIRVRPSLTLVGPRGAHGHSRRFNRPPLAWGCTSSRLVKGKADRRQVQFVVYSNCPMHSLRRSGSTNVSQSNHTPDFVSGRGRTTDGGVAARQPSAACSPPPGTRPPRIIVPAVRDVREARPSGRVRAG